MWKGKHVLLGISGGIAAYKTPELIRLFVKAGANVRVVVTKNALEFVTPLTLETLSKNNVYLDVFGPVNDYSTEHISLSDWADFLLVAPATADILGKFANGIADDALSTTYLAFNKPVFIAPAMNCRMYAHPAVQNNLNVLLSRGVTCIGPAEGELACGVTGKGRMEDPMKIFNEVSKTLSGQAPWSGKKVLITAGPTYEKIDPVRFIGNYSSGKMGFALAEAAAKRGATVQLVTGPVSLTTQHPNIERIDVESAQQMYDVCVRLFPQTDIGILCAAVADFSPQTASDTKTKRGEDDLTLLLKPTKDIAATLGNSKRADQVLIGFALETDDELNNAQGKLERKNFDFIVLNSLKDKEAGFRYDTNKIRILNKDGYQFDFPLKSKQEVAEDILDTINDYLI